MPLSLTRGVGNLTSLISLSTTTGLAMLGGTLLPVRDNGGTLLGGVGGEYGLYLLLLALGMGFSMTMAAIAQWLMYPSRDELWSLGMASLLLTSPLLLRAPRLPNPLRAGLLTTLVLLCSLAFYLLALFFDTRSAPRECLDHLQRQVRLCIE